MRPASEVTIQSFVSRLDLSPGLLPPEELAVVATRAARAPDLWRPLVRHLALERWYCRLFKNQHLELWLLGWEVRQDTQIHDHGGSSGAFCVAEGRLVEHYADLGRPGVWKRREHRSGFTQTFGKTYVHNLGNDGPGVASSLHAYSPPLRFMSYYTLGRGLALERMRTLEVQGPEAGRIRVEPAPLETIG